MSKKTEKKERVDTIMRSTLIYVIIISAFMLIATAQIKHASTLVPVEVDNTHQVIYLPQG